MPPTGISRLDSRSHQMKTPRMIFRALAYTIIATASLSAQEKVAVLPPQGVKNVSEINKKTVRDAFLDYLSGPDSSFTAHDKNSIDMTIQRSAWRTSMLYDEKIARDIGRKLGVPLVCIIDLTREENECLIECKLVNVETGLAVSKSVIVSGMGNAELKKGSETAVRRLMASDAAATLIATHATTGLPTHAATPTPTAKPAVADHSTGNRTAAPSSASTKTAPPTRTPDTPTTKPAVTTDHSAGNKTAAPGGTATKTAPPARLPAAQPPPTGKWSFAAYGCAPDLGAYFHQSGDESSDGDNFDIKKDLNLKSDRMALGLRLDYMGNRCGFSLDVGSMAFAGQNRVARKIDIDGTEFENMDVTSSLKNTTIDLTGTVKILRWDQFWLGIDYGIQAWLLSVSAYGKSVSIPSQNESATLSLPVPIPQLGISFGAKALNDMLELRGKVHLLAYSGAKYTLFAADARYYPLPWVGMRAFVENQAFDVPYGSIDEKTEARLDNNRFGAGVVFRF